MTVGTRDDNYTTPTITSNGIGFPGRRYYKTWSGGDAPRVVYPKVNGSPRPKGLQTIFRRPVKRARVEDHAYEMSTFSTSDAVFEYRYFSSFPYVFRTGTVGNSFGGPALDYEWGDDDVSILIHRLHEKISGTDFNPAVAASQLPQATHMIIDSATRIYKAAKHIRSGNYAKAASDLIDGTRRKIRKTTANNWLELQYGWLPLLQDAHDAAIYLAHHLSVPPQQKVTVRHTKIGKVGSGSPLVAYEQSFCKTKMRICAIIREVDVVTLSGIVNPANIAWELLPFSFVLDWFIPIGNFLEARLLNQALRATYVVTKYQYWSASALKPTPFGDSVAEWVGIEHSSSGASVTRQVLDELDVPFPRYTGFIKNLSWRKAANAVGLVTQAAGSNKRNQKPPSLRPRSGPGIYNPHGPDIGGYNPAWNSPSW